MITPIEHHNTIVAMHAATAVEAEFPGYEMVSCKATNAARFPYMFTMYRVEARHPAKQAAKVVWMVMQLNREDWTDTRDAMGATLHKTRADALQWADGASLDRRRREGDDPYAERRSEIVEEVYQTVQAKWDREEAEAREALAREGELADLLDPELAEPELLAAIATVGTLITLNGGITGYHVTRDWRGEFRFYATDAAALNGDGLFPAGPPAPMPAGEVIVTVAADGTVGLPNVQPLTEPVVRMVSLPPVPPITHPVTVETNEPELQSITPEQEREIRARVDAAYERAGIGVEDPAAVTVGTGRRMAWADVAAWFAAGGPVMVRPYDKGETVPVTDRARIHSADTVTWNAFTDKVIDTKGYPEMTFYAVEFATVDTATSVPVDDTTEAVDAVTVETVTAEPITDEDHRIMQDAGGRIVRHVPTGMIGHCYPWDSLPDTGEYTVEVDYTRPDTWTTPEENESADAMVESLTNPTDDLDDYYDDVETVQATDLRPGTIVVNDSGERWFAAFDVAATGHGTIRVWTAVPDQERGVPEVLEFDWDVELTVQPRTETTWTPVRNLATESHEAEQAAPKRRMPWARVLVGLLLTVFLVAGCAGNVDEASSGGGVGWTFAAGFVGAWVIGWMKLQRRGAGRVRS